MLRHIGVMFLVLLVLGMYMWLMYVTTERSLQQLEKEKDDLCKRIHAKVLPQEFRHAYVLPSVFTREECNWIIQESERHASHNGWSSKRHQNYPTVDIEIDDKTHILKSFIHRAAFERILPEIEHKYHLPRRVLGITEIFVVKYDVNGQQFLEPHQDGSEFSFVAVLNDGFTGGGTYFIDQQKNIDANVGSVIVFCGQNKHMGKEITSGTRYILAGFLNFGYENRCQKEGLLDLEE